MGAAQQLPGVGVAALEDSLERLRGGDPLLTEGRGAGAVPAARSLTVAAQVLLAVVGNLADVVVLPPHRQLRQIRDHPCHPAPPPPCSANAPVVHCCRVLELDGTRGGQRDYGKAEVCGVGLVRECW